MRSRSMARGAWVAAGLILAVFAGLMLLQALGPGTLIPISSVIAAPPVGDIPALPAKPPPSAEDFNGCPAQGRGGDSDLNLLKNRVDKGAYLPVSFDSLLALTWPKSTERTLMRDWSPSAHAFIAQYLGIPIVVEGYIQALREGVADPANCNRRDDAGQFWRLTLTEGPRDKRSQAVIGMSSPQTRVGHTWSAQFIRDFIVAGRVPVRISGWLYFNPDPLQEIGRTRATLWEITPVLQIEVYQDGRWNPLDKYAK